MALATLKLLGLRESGRVMPRQSAQRRFLQRPYRTRVRISVCHALGPRRRVKVVEVNGELVDRRPREIDAGSLRVALHDLAPVVE